MAANALIIEALPLSASFEDVQAATRVHPTLPLKTEGDEIRALKREGWTDPRGLFGYSSKSLYKDLYAYFDVASKGPRNELATKALKMYGLGGAPGEPNWDVIRGPIVIFRLEPSNFGGGTYNPVLTVEEMVETFNYFRTKNAAKVAQQRDAQRAYQFLPSPDNGIYVGPAGNRPLSKVTTKDARQCAYCGTSRLVSKLKRCSKCTKVYYCNASCQKLHWKASHKHVCSPPLD